RALRDGQLDLREIDRACRAALVDELDERGGDFLADRFLRLFGRAADVWRQDHVREPAQRRIESVTVRLGLARIDVDGGAADVTALEGGGEGVDLDHGAAARIEQT